jgi:hypothetical protein
LNMKMKAKVVKPGIKMNTNLRNIKNLENELIWAELCQMWMVCEKPIRNTDPKCITINKFMTKCITIKKCSNFHIKSISILYHIKNIW